MLNQIMCMFCLSSIVVVAMAWVTFKDVHTCKKRANFSIQFPDEIDHTSQEHVQAKFDHKC